MATTSTRRGRPRAKEIDAGLLGLLAFHGADIPACAVAFGLSRGTMTTRLREQSELKATYERGRAGFEACNAARAAMVMDCVRETRNAAA
jgi:hypothetical protein